MTKDEPDFHCPKCGANKKDLEILVKVLPKVQVHCTVCSKVSVIVIEK